VAASWLVCEAFIVGMAHIQKFEGALEELVDFSFANFMRREKRMKIEVGEAAVGDARRKKFAETAGLDRAKGANFLEDDAAKRVLKNGGVEQATDFGASAAFDQHGAQEAQRVAFQERVAVLWMRNHRNL